MTDNKQERTKKSVIRILHIAVAAAASAGLLSWASTIQNTADYLEAPTPTQIMLTPGTAIPDMDEDDEEESELLGTAAGPLEGELVDGPLMPGPDYVTAAPTEAPLRVCIVNTAVLNARSGPGTQHPIVGSFDKGAKLHIYAEATDKANYLWYQVEGGVWVASWLTREEY